MYKEIVISSVGRIMEVDVTGKLTREDYALFISAIEPLIKEYGKIRVLFVLHDFHGWTAGAVWEDLKFDVKHFTDIERMGIAGEKKWEHGLAVIGKPFTAAKLRYFDLSELDAARAWIDEE